MNIGDVAELQYITHVGNVPSILQRGILSHQGVARLGLGSVSVASEEIQARRRRVRVPIPGGSRPLHSYANLYFSARNPMLRLLLNQHGDLCVLRVRKDVLELPGVVVTDRNAAVDYVRFGDGVNGLAIVDRDLVFAEYWTDPDPIVYRRRKSAKCAEVLVPDAVAPGYICGAYVSTADGQLAIHNTCRLPNEFEVKVDGHLFFL